MDQTGKTYFMPMYTEYFVTARQKARNDKE